MATGEGQATKEQTIQDLVAEQSELLYKLVNVIDTLVERNPRPEATAKEVAQRPDNVFDEIIDTLHRCRGLGREAIEKVEAGIIAKVN